MGIGEFYNNVQGTYYYDDDQEDKSFYGYTFDQVLLRPSLIDRFNLNEFKIINSINGQSLIKNAKINKKDFSDHLPIQFEIN
jgi:poly(3-hydroxyalkanoate) synthetase